jgi:hypothetical protein
MTLNVLFRKLQRNAEESAKVSSGRSGKFSESAAITNFYYILGIFEQI